MKNNKNQKLRMRIENYVSFLAQRYTNTVTDIPLRFLGNQQSFQRTQSLIQTQVPHGQL